jgi:hypothetical protein
MKKKHRKTMTAVMAKPTLANIAFADIEAMLIALGCEVEEGAGSRVVFIRDEHRLHMHRPHPGREAKRYQVDDVRDFLAWIGEPK